MTLDRPEHNLLNEAMLRELADGISFAGERSDVKLIVLDSAHKVFCGGIDIGEYTSQRVFQMLDAFHAAFSGMLEAAKPVVCVVNGPAIGGGAELAAFGDFVIATPKARFAQPEISIGIFPPLASTILPFLVGPKIALELVLTGEAVTAERHFACTVGGGGGGKGGDVGRRARHCDRPKGRKPGYPPLPQRPALFARKSAGESPRLSRGAFLL